eukprot:4832874-Prymnesium_polylepis.2
MIANGSLRGRRFFFLAAEKPDFSVSVESDVEFVSPSLLVAPPLSCSLPFAPCCFPWLLAPARASSRAPAPQPLPLAAVAGVLAVGALGVALATAASDAAAASLCTIRSSGGSGARASRNPSHRDERPLKAAAEVELELVELAHADAAAPRHEQVAVRRVVGRLAR